MIIIVLVSGQVIDMIDSAVPERTSSVPTSSEGISFFYLLSWWNPLNDRDSVDTNGCREGPVSIY